MKQQTSSLLWIVALLGFAAASWSANRLYDWKIQLSPYEAKLPTQFYAGMDKFLSNLTWMTLIQWQADEMQTRSTSSPDKLYEKLNALTNLDPLFADAYLDGALALSNSNPDNAIKLLEKAMNMGLENNWKVPFYAGQIKLMNTKDPANAESAVGYFMIASRAPEAPEYVQTAMLHAKCVQVNEEPLASIQIWYDHYQTLQGVNQASQRNAAMSQINGYAESASTDLDEKLQSTTDPEARATLLKNRAKIAKIVDDVKNNVEAKPTSQPAT